MSTITIKKPRTTAQAEASRTNGAQSQGPTTEAGKAKISTTRMTHGFRSNSVTLANEDRTAYDQRLDSYLARYSPIDQAEEDLVGLLASSMWQVMRINSIEVALFDYEISGIDVDIKGKFQDMDEYGRLALAFKKSAGDNALELLRRYKATAERAYHRALQALEEIRKERLKGPPDQPESKSTDQPGPTTQAAAEPTTISKTPIQPLILPPPATKSENGLTASSSVTATSKKLYIPASQFVRASNKKPL